MATNPFFNQKSPAEQALLDSMIVEQIKMFGQDMVYVPREMIKEDRLFGEGKWYKFNDPYTIEMYIESVNGFEGAGDLVSKFGLQVKDRITLIMSQKRFTEQITNYREDIKRPREGDLIFMPLSRSLFEINFIEHEVPFYIHGRNYTYKITCELFNYDHSKMDTGITEIDALEEERHWIPKLLFVKRIPSVAIYGFYEGETVRQYLENPSSIGNTTGSILSTGTLIQYNGVSGIDRISSAYITTLDSFAMPGATAILHGEISGAKQYIHGITASNTLIPKNSLTGENFGDNDITSLEVRQNNVINYCETDPFSEGTP
jgi:hypothetical protein